MRSINKEKDKENSSVETNEEYYIDYSIVVVIATYQEHCVFALNP